MDIFMVRGTGRPEYKDAVTIRTAVFIDEQGIDPKLELDQTDEDKLHYIGYVDDVPVTTARVDFLAGNKIAIQRVATVAEARHQGHSRELLDQVIRDAKASGIGHIQLDAQKSAIPFYEKMGFKPVGEPFEEVGIAHQTMELAD